MAYESATHDGFTVESSSETADQIRESFASDVAASELEETPTPAPGDEPAVEAVAEPKAAKPRNDPRARVEAATAKEAEAKRLAAAAEERAAKAEARIAELEARNAPKPAARAEAPAADAEPTVDQFDSYEKFVDARARWAARQEWDSREKAKRDAEAEQHFDREVHEVDAAFYSKLDAIVSADAEFIKRLPPSLTTSQRLGAIPLKVRNHPDFVPTFGNVVMEEVFTAQHPKEMLEYVTQPDNIQRLATLPHAKFVRELARFDNSLGAASTAAPAPKAPVSHAKAPIRPLGTSPVAVSDVPDDDAPIEKHIAYYNGLDRKSGRR